MCSTSDTYVSRPGLPRSPMPVPRPRAFEDARFLANQVREYPSELEIPLETAQTESFLPDPAPSDRLPTENLDPAFRIRRAPKFFFPGRVFLVLWDEPAGESDAHRTSLNASRRDGSIHYTRYGQCGFSKVRRFVVIRPGPTYSSCLPILTYGGRGVSGKTIQEQAEHAIAYTGRNSPRPLPGEQALQPTAMRVDPDSAGDQLAPDSRLHLGKIYTVEHNVKVKAFGMVNQDSIKDLQQQFHTVWIDKVGMRNGRKIFDWSGTFSARQVPTFGDAANEVPVLANFTEAGEKDPELDATGLVAKAVQQDPDRAKTLLDPIALLGGWDKSDSEDIGHYLVQPGLPDRNLHNPSMIRTVDKSRDPHNSVENVGARCPPKGADYSAERVNTLVTQPQRGTADDGNHSLRGPALTPQQIDALHTHGLIAQRRNQDVREETTQSTQTPSLLQSDTRSAGFHDAVSAAAGKNEHARSGPDVEASHVRPGPRTEEEWRDLLNRQAAEMPSDVLRDFCLAQMRRAWSQTRPRPPKPN